MISDTLVKVVSHLDFSLIGVYDTLSEYSFTPFIGFCVSYMITISANLLALAIYVAASIYLGWQFSRNKTAERKPLLTTVGIALAVHGIGLWGISVAGSTVNFTMFSLGSLMFWIINAIVLLSSLKKPAHNLFLLLFPLSALAVLSSFWGNKAEWSHQLSYTVASHIILSILAYSLLTIASLQALLLAYQNRALKNKTLLLNSRLLPPLQTMEALLFEFLWVGELLLSLAILSGFYFLEDVFAQHLAHKTIFALIAWFIYALLLWGRFKLGWRGNTAIRWALAGFVCLMLAYFGSKIVLELVLQRI
jgi:ABC-type uncharacterized transport system permease subunit